MEKMNNNSNDGEWMKNQKLLVISPHPDDAIIGCGGLMAKIKSMGGEVYVMTIVLGDEPQYGSESKADKRKEEEVNAMKALNVDGHEIALKDGNFHLKLDAMPQKELIDLIEKKSLLSIEKLKPTIVAAPSIHSENQDHVAVATAAFTALRPRPHNLKHFTNTVIAYEQGSTFWSLGSFKPDFFVDISAHIKEKMDALSFYKSQIPAKGESPRTLESIETLSKLRGSNICVKYAEAFELLRIKI